MSKEAFSCGNRLDTLGTIKDTPGGSNVAYMYTTFRERILMTTFTKVTN